MRWFNWLGVALQVVGLLGAMLLLARLRETVTGREVVPLRWVRVGWQRLRALARRLLRRRPPTVTLEPDSLVTEMRMGSPVLTQNHAPMPAGLAVDARVAWLDGYVRELERRHNDLSVEVGRQASAQDDAVRATRDYAESEIRQAVEDVRAEVRQLVGKDVGWEIVSLAVVAVGVVLAAV
jgi:tetrahydromethanopterin S-methyltransferase subunit G